MLILLTNYKDEKVEIHRSINHICFASGRTGLQVSEICLKMGISNTTFYNWKKKHEGPGIPELHCLRQLEEENERLKQ